MDIRRVALCSISTNDKAMEHIESAKRIVNAKGIECFSLFAEDGCDEHADLIIALGGDGTILRSKAFSRRCGAPVLGVNIGRVGFLSECGIDGLADALDAIMRDTHTIERNMMLDCMLPDGSEQQCANDFIVYKPNLGTICHFEILMNDLSYGDIFGDGVVVCTPLGSTGYSLSAGGAVISTAVRAIGVTPICPHSIGARHFVAPADEASAIAIRMITAGILTCDGICERSLLPGDVISITPSVESFDLVRLSARSLYGTIRSKLQ
ncbi:MAG: NAD(+)/NADH kinase [Clostridia bacterium]|nr:NAD(+)/NADH kinase [Clostridia bacterium]